MNTATMIIATTNKALNTFFVMFNIRAAIITKAINASIIHGTMLISLN